ncbi:MAG: molybdate ABC transporter substrate-binding protein [Sphingomonadaceae bacterium]|nr:molybdate ABC transporter substrate-binding protein [Sphingomonadaceae bacterium]
MLIRFHLIWFAAAIVLLTGGCTENRKPDGPLVLAAASLQDALTDAADAWTAQGHPKPVLSFAGTPSLARQAMAGAPADMLIFADEKWMDELDAIGAIRPESRRPLLTNSLVLIAPAGSDLDLKIEPGFPVTATLGAGRLAIANPDSVPAGRYAKQALISLGAWEAAANRIAASENVRIALALVARKEAALGIVYATDAKVEPGVAVIGTFPAGSHAPVTYPMAILKKSQNPETQAFSDYLLSDQAQTIFRAAGFKSPPR